MGTDLLVAAVVVVLVVVMVLRSLRAACLSEFFRRRGLETVPVGDLVRRSKTGTSWCHNPRKTILETNQEIHFLS